MPKTITTKAPQFGFRRAPAKALTAMAWQIKRESLLPQDKQQARRAAKAEAVGLAVLLALMALGALTSCAPSLSLTDTQHAAPVVALADTARAE